MSTRANYQKLSGQTVHHLLAFDKSLAESPLDRTIINLVKIRASQINGCLFCLDMHTKEARTHGEREIRVHHLALWHESGLYSEKERAALEWVELLTYPSDGVEDEDYANLAAHFSEKEISDLTLVVSSINAWNRLGIAFKPQPGSLDKLLGLEKIGLY